MSFFVSRAVSKGPSQDRADIFARGEAAVLVVAGDLECVREAVLDEAFDLREPARWTQLLAANPATVVVLVPGMVVHVSTGRGQAWLVRPDDVARLPMGVSGELSGRLLVANDALFRDAAEANLARIVRTERFGRVGDALVELADDVAVLVAER